MGKFIFLGIALIFFIGILKSHGANRLIWFFSGAFFMQDRIILLEYPTLISFDRFLILTLVLSEIFSGKNLFKELRKFPLVKPFIIVFLGMLIIATFDERHGIYLNLYRSTDYFLKSFFLIFLCYVSFENNFEWKKLIKFFLVASIILSLYGLYNFITKSNPYDAYITKSFNSLSYFDEYAQQSHGRFRVNSFTSHPIYYGYLSGVLCITALYSFLFLKELKTLSLIAIPFTFINLVLANSLTPILSFIIGLLIFIFYGLKEVKRANLLFWITLICIGLCSIPLIQDKIDVKTEISNPTQSAIAGSTLSMRAIQLKASYKEFLNNPVFGNGIYYINENLGWHQNAKKIIRYKDFQGFESYVYLLLIEQGFIGILINLIFFSGILIYFLRKRSRTKEIATFGLAILGMFLTFIVGTGTVNSWVISMGFMGILVKYIELEIRKNKGNYI